MEPSTSSDNNSKRSRRVLYDKKEVLGLLLGDSSENESFYEDSGSDYETSRSSSLGSDTESSDDHETPKAGKKRQAPANKSRSSSKKQKTSEKGKKVGEKIIIAAA
ncbi:hypothetical protein PoB_001622600 [Plakobranchus ocellatus]|uniref:Uncharacterized protein n=1 Tax=Plakobranchus ocellatus TaxID=259542 RepID=A0AAV3YRG1_9GAST|nr:hypothetical protein PoB_001622600 [Plakobranchus ocellatus]